MNEMQRVIEKMAALVEEQKGLFAKCETPDHTDADLTRIEEITVELSGLDEKKAQLKRVEDLKADNARRAAELASLGDRPGTLAAKAADASPARAVSRVTLRNIQGDGAHERAYKLGSFFLAAITKNAAATEWCRKNGVELRAHTEGNDTAGGVLVPTELDDELIVLREKYGVFRQFAKRKTMKSDTRSIPRRRTGLTAYFMGEGQTIQESQKGWDRVNLTAKRVGVLAKYSNDLAEDAIIDIGDDLAGEISYAFALLEDTCGFMGTGAQNMGAIIGVLQKLATVFGSLAANPGVHVSAQTGFAAAWNFLLPDFTATKGLLPQYADTPNAGWFCHKTFYHQVMERLALAAGGTRAAEVAEGRNEPLFLGYPVHYSQVMPSAPAINQVPVVFGDLSLAAMFGDRRQTTIAMSEHLNFAEDEIAIRGIERFDINVHDVGDTVTGRPGPVVGLATNNS